MAGKHKPSPAKNPAHAINTRPGSICGLFQLIRPKVKHNTTQRTILNLSAFFLFGDWLQNHEIARKDNPYPAKNPEHAINTSPGILWGVFAPNIPKVKHIVRKITILNQSAFLFFIFSVFAFPSSKLAALESQTQNA